MRNNTMLLVSLLALSSACSNAALKCTNAACEPESSDNLVTVNGEVCTADPNSLLYPYKFIFVVDISGSTGPNGGAGPTGTDPQMGRQRAVTQVVNQYINVPGVEFAVISFTDTPNLLTNFTKDAAKLAAIEPMLSRSEKDTDYDMALKMVQTLIANDAAGQSADLLARTRYDIEFVSDGQPQIAGGCESLDEVNADVKAIMAMQKTLNVNSLKLSTLYLTCPAGVTCFPANTCNGVTPNMYLQDMANDGNGTFTALASDQLKFNIDMTQIVRPFVKQQFYLVNENRVLKKNVITPDSDGDGVSDGTEMTEGTDPLTVSSDKSGCSDRVNELLLPNKGLCAQSCNPSGQAMASLPDSDEEGLFDCEEAALGSKKTLADSDGDTLIDSLEARFGTAISDPKTATQDSDGDGVSDLEEVREGTDPLFPEADRANAYTYTPLTPAPASLPGTTCYNFSIGNVRLATTQATATAPAGHNQLCVDMLQATSDNPLGPPTVTRACTQGSLTTDAHGNPKVTPANGVLRLTPADFKPVICPGGCSSQ